MLHYSVEDIEPEEMDEPLPQIGEAKHYTWHEVTGDLLNPQAQQREAENTLPPLVQVMPEPDLELPSAPFGRPAFRKIEGSLFLPEPVASDVQRHATELDERILPSSPPRDEEELCAQSLEEAEPFPSLGGGYRLPSFVVPLKKMKKKTKTKNMLGASQHMMTN